MSTHTVLTLDGVSKRYPNGTVAVDSLSLELNHGEVFGILGPNGSGKTTTILMILGLTEPTHGTIGILGLNPLRSPLAVKRQVAYMPDTVGFYEDMTAFANLDYTARFLGLDASERKGRIVGAMEKMGVADRMNDKVRTFSHGMKRRLGLAEVLVKKPSAAILDEPTQGLDPRSVSEFLDLILSLKRDEGITILLSSHHLNEVQSVCDRVGLFHKGKMDLYGTLDELAAQLFGGDHETIVRVGSGDIVDLLRQIPSVSDVQALGDHAYRVTSAGEIRPQIARLLVGSDIELFGMEARRHSLDAVYQAYYKEVHDAA